MKINGRFSVTNQGHAIYMALCNKRGGASVFDAAVEVFDTSTAIDRSQFKNDDHRVMYISKIADGMLGEKAIIDKNLAGFRPIPMQQGFTDFPEADMLRRQREDAERCIMEVDGEEGQ